jgi:hypothetical protein
MVLSRLWTKFQKLFWMASVESPDNLPDDPAPEELTGGILEKIKAGLRRGLFNPLVITGPPYSGSLGLTKRVSGTLEIYMWLPDEISQFLVGPNSQSGR